MNINKRGLSDVVTTVLIILLVLVAIGLIWAYVLPTLQSSGKNINSGAACLQSQIEAVNCTYSTTGYVVSVKRTDSLSTVSGYKIILYKGDGSSNVTDGGSIVGIGESKTSNIIVASANTYKFATAAEVLKIDGADTVCGESPNKISCTG